MRRFLPSSFISPTLLIPLNALVRSGRWYSKSLVSDVSSSSLLPISLGSEHRAEKCFESASRTAGGRLTGDLDNRLTLDTTRRLIGEGDLVRRERERLLVMSCERDTGTRPCGSGMMKGERVLERVELRTRWKTFRIGERLLDVLREWGTIIVLGGELDLERLDLG